MLWIYLFLLLSLVQPHQAQLLVTADGEVVYLIDVGTGSAQRLGDGYRPTWSPDGEWMMWTTNVNTSAGHHRELWIANHSGEEPQMIVHSPDALHAFWSPDNHQIAWLTQVENHTELGLYDLRDDTNRTLRTIEGRMKVQWSPDSQQISWAEETSVGAGGTNFSLWVTDLQSLDQRELIQLPRYGGAIGWEWSPDGTHLLVEAHNSSAPDDVPASEIYVLSISEGEPFVEPLGRSAVWSPTGHHAAWLARDASTVSDLVIYSVTIETQHYALDLPWETDLLWSPDGDLLAIMTDTDVLHVLNVESGLIMTHTSVQEATWTPDGRLIYRSSVVNDDLDWYLLERPDVDDAAQFWLKTPVTNNPALFSPDGFMMAVALDTFSSTGSYRIGVASLTQSNSLQIYPYVDEVGRVLELQGWYGDYVLFSTRSSQSGVGDYQYGLLDTSVGTLTRITIGDNRTVHDAAWRP